MYACKYTQQKLILFKSQWKDGVIYKFLYKGLNVGNMSNFEIIVKCHESKFGRQLSALNFKGVMNTNGVQYEREADF